MKTKRNWKQSIALAIFVTMGISSSSCKNSKKPPLSEDNKTATEDLESLVEKLEVVHVESDMWLLLFKSFLGNQHLQFDLMHKPFGDSVKTNRIPASKAVSKGETFFSSDPSKDRFKLKDVRIENLDGRPKKIAIVEDLSEQKKGKIYELPFNMKLTQRRHSTQYDHSVIFSLNALDQEHHHFKIEENSSFSLPHGKEEKPYKLIEVKLDDSDSGTRKAVAVIVQYEINGVTKTRQISVPQPKQPSK